LFIFLNAGAPEAAKSAATSKDWATAEGMAKKMQRWTFLVEIALMRDVLDALKTLLIFAVPFCFSD